MHRFTPPTPVDSARRDTISLIFDSWEIECCVPPPVVGDAMSLMLSFQADPEGPEVPGLARPYTWTLQPLSDSPGETSDCGRDVEASRAPSQREALATSGGVIAYWRDAPTVAGPLTVAGYLTADRHGGVLPEEVPTITGEVVRIQVMRRTLVETTPRTLEPVPGSVRLRDVRRSPRRFDYTVLQEATPHRVSEENALVLDLRVARPARSEASRARSSQLR